jgi:hypothetical protein
VIVVTGFHIQPPESADAQAPGGPGTSAYRNNMSNGNHAQRQSRPGSPNRATRSWAAWMVPAAAIALVVLLVPSSTSGALLASTTLKAPFTTATVTLTNPMTHAGTGKNTLVAKAFFNKTTGIGGFSDNASATFKSTSANNSAFASGRIQLSLPITITTTGRHTLTVVWVTMATGSVNLTPGTCRGNATVASTSCTRFAQAFVHGFANLVDKTNGSTIRVQTWPGNFTSVWTNTTCAFAVCTSSSSTAHSGSLHTGKAFWSWIWSSVALVSTHTYVIQMFLFGGAQVTLLVHGATLRSASGNAQLNSATTGNDEVLSSVTIA